TFTGVTEKAQKSAALQNAENAWKEFLGEYADKMDSVQDFDGAIKSGDYFFEITDGQLKDVIEGTFDTTGKTSYPFNNCTIYLTKDLKISAALQNAKNAWTNYIATNIAESGKSFCIKSEVDGTVYYFHVVNGEFKTEAVEDHSSCASATKMKVATVGNELTLTTPEDNPSRE
ncbi:MAG: hypothetical protein PUK12_01635, partial [Clostridiales bacterium]|nr:hypothetical protein [Clostridiales bacterium]MDY5726309.1 hypothetical protein [Eubacteriales bacterium]